MIKRRHEAELAAEVKRQGEKIRLAEEESAIRELLRVRCYGVIAEVKKKKVTDLTVEESRALRACDELR